MSTLVFSTSVEYKEMAPRLDIKEHGKQTTDLSTAYQTEALINTKMHSPESFPEEVNFPEKVNRCIFIGICFAAKKTHTLNSRKNYWPNEAQEQYN